MKIELIEGGTIPKRATDGSVGYDCYAREVTSLSDNSASIKLGFKVDCNDPNFQLNSLRMRSDGGLMIDGFDMNFGTFLFPRSGWARDYGFRLKNSVGVIDPDYRGEVIAEVEFDNYPPELLSFVKQQEGRISLPEPVENYSVRFGDIYQPRVCQMIFMPCYVGELVQVDKLDDTERGAGGFGSTN